MPRHWEEGEDHGELRQEVARPGLVMSGRSYGLMTTRSDQRGESSCAGGWRSGSHPPYKILNVVGVRPAERFQRLFRATFQPWTRLWSCCRLMMDV